MPMLNAHCQTVDILIKIISVHSPHCRNASKRQHHGPAEGCRSTKRGAPGAGKVQLMWGHYNCFGNCGYVVYARIFKAYEIEVRKSENEILNAKLLYYFFM